MTKDARVFFRMTKRDKARLSRQAKAKGWTASEYLRRLVESALKKAA